MDDATADAYLARIGATREPPSAAAVTTLMGRHLTRVPFENLSIHLGERIALDEAALVDKIVGRRRGGFCYELNGAFALLLQHLGYDVTMLAARVYGDAGPGPLFDHLTLRVDVDEAPCWSTSGSAGSSRHRSGSTCATTSTTWPASSGWWRRTRATWTSGSATGPS